MTGGAVGWQAPPEIRLEKVTADGFLIRQPQRLAHLPTPWPEARPHGEVMIELKLAGNHLDRKAVARALLRRQAREVQRLEEDDAWRGEEPLWLIAPHRPPWLQELRRPARFAPGCYWVEPQWKTFLWIAANELPLVDELIPFLLVRSGQALDEFCRWVAPRRPLEWVLSMPDYLPMSMPTHEELRWRFGKAEDPAIEARRQRLLDSSWRPAPRRSSSFSRKRGWPRPPLPCTGCSRVDSSRRARTTMRASTRAPPSRPWSAGSTELSPRPASRTCCGSRPRAYPEPAA